MGSKLAVWTKGTHVDDPVKDADEHLRRYVEWRRETGRCADLDCDGDADHEGPHYAWVPE